MTETYWKAVRPDGMDFWSGTVRWLPKTPLKRSRVVRHPSSTRAVKGDHATSLAVSTDPRVLPGALWPMRLCRVEQVEDVIITDAYKRQSVAWRVVEEVDPSFRFGPQGLHVATLVDRVRAITAGEVGRFDATRDATRVANRYAAREASRVAACVATRVATREAAWDATQFAVPDAAWVAAWVAAWDATQALVVRDLIGQHGFTQAHYDTLTLPWRTTIGPVHPDDPEVSTRPHDGDVPSTGETEMKGKTQ